MSVGTYLKDEWLPAIRASVRPGTWDHYAKMLQAYVVPRIGARRLGALQPNQLNRLYADLLVDGRRNGGPTRPAGLSPRTVRHVHTMLHKAFADAVRWGRIARNPADRSEPPRPKTPEMKVWDIGHLRAFLSHVADDRLHAIWLLMVTTGMRRGEVLGLRWSDVDLEGARLSVVQTVVMVDRKIIVSEPKTARRRRSIALDAATVAALRQLRRRQAEERLRYGELWKNAGLVTVHKDGSPISPRLLSSWFTQHARAANLPRIRLHDVRHSYATAARRRARPSGTSRAASRAGRRAR